MLKRCFVRNPVLAWVGLQKPSEKLIEACFEAGLKLYHLRSAEKLELLMAYKKDDQIVFIVEESWLKDPLVIQMKTKYEYSFCQTPTDE